ncbi:MAG: hypothetical protein KTR32_03825 [Granulosicoccus sp.]|nr:hypothetical protein [Granulosicoccus sp.]
MARSSDSNFLVAFFRDKTFQAREIRRVIGLSLVYLIITTALVGIFYHHMLDNLLQGMAPLLFVSEDIALTNDVIPAIGAVLGNWLLVMLAINTIITACVAIYITRHLGQPLLAIKRALNEIGDGNLDVRLRSSDNKDFNELVSALTSATHSIRVQISAAKEQMNEIKTLRQTRPITDNPEMNTALDNCHGALEFFQVDKEPELSLIDIDDIDDANRVA